jgi:hypothetical protein
MKVVVSLLIVVLFVEPTEGLFNDFFRKALCKLFPRIFKCPTPPFEYDDLFQFQFHERLFGPSKDEDGNFIYPTYILTNGWTDPKISTFPAETVDGQMFQLQIIEIVRSWDQIIKDILANETDVDQADFQKFQSAFVLAAIGVNNTFLGYVTEVNSTRGVATYVFPVDEAEFYGYTLERRQRQLQTENPVAGCPNFFAEVLSGYECSNPEEKVKVDNTCKVAAERTYTTAIAVANGEYDTAIAVAKGVFETAKAALLALKIRRYAIALAGCALLTAPLAIALCVARAIVVIEGPLIAAKLLAQKAFDLAVAKALSDLQGTANSACDIANAAALACIDCVPCDLEELGIECCVASDCGDPLTTDFTCETNKCIQNGNPRFTLTWYGDGTCAEFPFSNINPLISRLDLFSLVHQPHYVDDLDIHVITPGGFEIYFQRVFDSVSGGRLDQDDIPQTNGLYVENIFFPLDGSAPRGTYTYFVDNYNQIGEADSWTLQVYLGDTLQISNNGVVGESGVGTRFTFAF